MRVKGDAIFQAPPCLKGGDRRQSNTMKFTPQTWSIGRLMRRIRRRALHFGRQGLNLLFPPRCVHCEADLPATGRKLGLCPDCRMALGPVVWPGCGRCGALEWADSRRRRRNRPVYHRALLRFTALSPLWV